MSDTYGSFSDYAKEKNWGLQDQVDILLDYIANQQSPEAFEDFILEAESLEKVEKSHYLIVVEGDVSPCVKSGNGTMDDVMKMAAQHRETDPNLTDGLYVLEIDHNGVPEMDTFAGDFCLDSAQRPDIPCIRIEYDLKYFGGDYNDVGKFVFVPTPLIEVEGSVENAFTCQTGFKAMHIIHYSNDDLYTADGDVFDS